MRYQALTLDHIYTILSEMEKPIALFDFISGEMGYEALCAQAVCGKFYDNFGCKMPVIALCWKGGSLLYSNVSHHQIELADVGLSMAGNLSHRGEIRWASLVLKRHRNCIENIAGITEYMPAMYWVGGHVDEHRLLGYLSPDRLETQQYPATRQSLIHYTKEHLVGTQFIFEPVGAKLVDTPYIALFDRNEPRIGRSRERNMALRHVKLMYDIAKSFGLRLVVVHGLHPRRLMEDIIYVDIGHRDMDRLCNIIWNSLLFVTPACGVAEVAAIFGCNLLATHRLGVGYTDLVEMITQRGFDYLGVLDEIDNDRVVQYVESKCSVL